MSSCSVVIAIDGPSASGKSTLAKALAKRLKFDYLDTGAMYRALAWRAIKAEISLKDRIKLAAFCKKQKIGFLKKNGRFKVLINGEDVSGKIRTPKISESASILSEIGGVRKIMIGNQQRLAKGKKVILEGRDIGTVVFPKADCKIFLDAFLDERAERRYKELLERGKAPDKKKLKDDLSRRDFRDCSRRIAPLKKARDAVLLDSTALTISEMLRKALKIIALKIKANDL